MRKAIFGVLVFLMAASAVIAAGHDENQQQPGLYAQQITAENQSGEGYQEPLEGGDITPPDDLDKPENQTGEGHGYHETGGEGNLNPRGGPGESEWVPRGDREAGDISGAGQNTLMRENAVRIAVHALLAVENRTGGIGRNISQIAREFNNSVNKTLQAEEKIRNRNGIVKFFLGGDEGVAEEIENETIKNEEHLKNLEGLLERCECDESTKALIQEQITNIGQEQERLRLLADSEKKNKGILGWLWK